MRRPLGHARGFHFSQYTTFDLRFQQFYVTFVQTKSEARPHLEAGLCSQFHNFDRKLSFVAISPKRHIRQLPLQHLRRQRPLDHPKAQIDLGVGPPPAKPRCLPLRADSAGREVSGRQVRRGVSCVHCHSSSLDWSRTNSARALESIWGGRLRTKRIRDPHPMLFYTRRNLLR
jgi:hypothetical protein